MQEQVPIGCRELSLRHLQREKRLVMFMSDVADIHVEATNFPFSFDPCSMKIRVDRPVVEREIRPNRNCFYRVVGITALRNFLDIPNVDADDLVWVKSCHYALIHDDFCANT
jgi:hypothetical protein